MMQATIDAPHNRHDTGFIDSVISRLPSELVKPALKQYASIYGHTEPTSEKRKAANLYLLGLDENRKAGTGRLLLQDRETIRRKADKLALDAARRNKAGGYANVVKLLGLHKIPEPVAADEAGQVARVCCPDWWKRQLTKQSERTTEAFAINSGFVRRGVSAYISKALLQHIAMKQQASLETMKGMEAINVDTGEVMDMEAVLKGSTANPEIRRIELMIRCRGFEDYAKEAGHTAAFYTLTAPSKYHASTWSKSAGRALNNIKFSGCTPRDTQQYLTTLWARIRAKLKRDGLNVYGFRVCEPHHDGTPHWHLLLFMAPEQQQAVSETMRAYAMAEDSQEHGAKKHRFTVELIDSSKGGATSYIAKYISKNINGFEVGEDQESGMDAQSSADSVRAWASLWGIRQFQMIGGAPVGVWRELRRIKHSDDETIQAAIDAADSGDWMQYLKLQGGADSDRKDQPLRCYTVERIDKETGQLLVNRYGETVAKVEGLQHLDFAKVETRIHEWIIQPKKNGFDVEGEAAWSTVNNCTTAPSNACGGLSHD